MASKPGPECRPGAEGGEGGAGGQLIDFSESRKAAKLPQQGRNQMKAGSCIELRQQWGAGRCSVWGQCPQSLAH